MGFRGVVFSDDIGMAAAESAGGVKARIDAHLDAGCDLVLVCAPALVEDARAAMAKRPLSNTAAISALLGRGACGGEKLRAMPRRSDAGPAPTDRKSAGAGRRGVNRLDQGGCGTQKK